MLVQAILGVTSLALTFAQSVNVTTVDYTDMGIALQGFLSTPADTSSALPAIIIIPDWDGVNDYEKQRATLIASTFGYVGFAADIYGADKHEVPDIDERIALANLYRSNSTLGNSRINAAISTVSSMPIVDSSKIALIGYCFGGTLVITYAISGEGSDSVQAIASFHGGLSFIPVAGPNVMPKLLVLSGGDDDAASDIYTLESTLNTGNATWEITRYSGIEHAFTVFADPRYNAWADGRSWESMQGFVAEAFGEVEYDGMEPDGVDVTTMNYTDVDGTELRGYLALPDESMYSVTGPAIVVLPNWDGVNNYEQLRATLLAEQGYVAFAADIYGKDLQEDLTFAEKVEYATYYRTNTSLFVQRIKRAIDLVKALDDVDEESVGLIGYCFGGTGVIEYAFSGNDDVKVVASFHGGLTSLPDTDGVDIEPYVLILSGGIDDANGNQTVLEMSLDEANADWEVSRYAEVDHGFTEWDGGAYSLVADARSWESMMLVLDELLPLPMEATETPMQTETGESDMTDTDTTNVTMSKGDQDSGAIGGYGCYWRIVGRSVVFCMIMLGTGV